MTNDEAAGMRFEEYRKQLLNIINKYIPKCTVYLFGSRARGMFREGSDIDLALDTGCPIELSVIFRIKNEIEETNIPFFVDVVDVQAASPDFKEQILKDGIIWKS